MNKTSTHRTSSLPFAWRMILLAASIVFCLVLSSDRAGGQSYDDHGDTPATATAITLGTSVYGRIDPGDDTDVFKIDLSRASGPTDVWAYTTGDVDTVGGLYDSDGNLLIFNDEGFLTDSLVFTDRMRNFSLRSVVPPGIYYVMIVSYRPNLGSYVLHTEAVTDPGSSLDTAKRLEANSRSAGTIDTADDEDYFRLDFTRSTHLFVDALSPNYVDLNGELLDSEGAEIGENIYSLSSVIHVHGRGFRILEDFSRGTYYLRVTVDDDPVLRPVPYSIIAIEDTDYTEFVEDCGAKTRALNDPDIRDPLYACQWHLESADYVDINAESAWRQGAKGEGVNIAVVDRGMDYRHEDLRDNVEDSLNHDYNDEGGIYNRFSHHGTHVAGIIAARDNSVGVRGVAPRATMYGYNLLAGSGRLSEALDAMTRNGDVTAVSNNSWGNRDRPWPKRASSLWEQAIYDGITNGNGGKGTFYVFSAGNGHLLGDDSNLDEYANYYGVTAVCSVHGRGARAPYSEMGANLWVCAPSNERPGSYGRGGRFGIATTEHSDRYVKDFGGTSAATPIVSGVAALMRSANPDLTWRDLKLILAASAQKNDPDNAGWENGARKYRPESSEDRYHFNHEYGFGLVDAGAAVSLAKQWVNVPKLENAGVGSGELALTIPDAPVAGEPTSATSTITLENGIGFTEFVEVDITLRHQSFRDLEIELVSPSGAVSRLAVPHDTYSDLITYVDFVRMNGSFRFGSAKHLGEDPNGEWTLRVTDRIHAGEGVLDSWRLSVYGHKPTPAEPAVDSVTAGPGSLTVAWSAPAHVSDFEVTAYDLRHIPTDADETALANWTILENVWTSPDGGDLEYDVTELRGGTRYDVQVRAVNKWGDGRWSATATGTPENMAPSFSEGITTTRSVMENTPAGGNVGDPVAALDDDTPTYTMDGPDAALFDIDSATGQITVGSGTALDFESGIVEYTVRVTATDMSLASASTTVTVIVTDVSLGAIGDRYDANRDEVIDSDEVLQAVGDYFRGIITGAEALEVVRMYFAN